jgi:hypothetical protein
MPAASSSDAEAPSLRRVSSLWWRSSCSLRIVAVVRRRESRMARAVARLREQRCPEEGSQEIEVSESILRVVNNRIIRRQLDAVRERSGSEFFMPSHRGFMPCSEVCGLRLSLRVSAMMVCARQ